MAGPVTQTATSLEQKRATHTLAWEAAMAADKAEDVAIPAAAPRGRYINKRALKNKAVAVIFNEKDLSDFVSGFHKRKKKRRKEAEKQQGEALRRKLLELRKKRRLEKEFALFGGAPPAAEGEGDENDEGDASQEEDEGSEPDAPISGIFRNPVTLMLTILVTLMLLNMLTITVVLVIKLLTSGIASLNNNRHRD